MMMMMMMRGLDTTYLFYKILYGANAFTLLLTVIANAWQKYLCHLKAKEMLYMFSIIFIINTYIVTNTI